MTRAVAICLCVFVAACSKSEHGSPTSPSAVAPVAAEQTVAGQEPMQQPTSAPTFGPALAPQSIRVPDGNEAAVAFPPRNEPFQFRRDLETYYQNTLRRPAIASFVDIEGTIVWTQEYLRYRLSGCSHQDALSRVSAQITGGGIPTECGGTSAFPPRNEPLAFRTALEGIYRDILRRNTANTFVDAEGDIVWTQEYLRYRVEGCGHADASRFVFDQIAGRGIAAGCGRLEETVSGAVSGGSPVCPDFFSTTRLPCVRYPFTPSTTGNFGALLIWDDPRNDLDLVLVANDGTRSTDRIAISRSASGISEVVTSLVTAGQRYEVRVLYFSGRSIQPYALAVQRPR